jgi:hypothetical protein
MFHGGEGYVTSNQGGGRQRGVAKSKYIALPRAGCQCHHFRVHLLTVMQCFSREVRTMLRRWAKSEAQFARVDRKLCMIFRQQCRSKRPGLVSSVAPSPDTCLSSSLAPGTGRCRYFFRRAFDSQWMGEFVNDTPCCWSVGWSMVSVDYRWCLRHKVVYRG